MTINKTEYEAGAEAAKRVLRKPEQKDLTAAEKAKRVHEYVTTGTRSTTVQAGSGAVRALRSLSGAPLSNREIDAFMAGVDPKTAPAARSRDGQGSLRRYVCPHAIQN